jgi:Rrf2 family protein
VNLGLSGRADYAVRSALCLARAYGAEEATKLREVSAEMGVPRSYVSQILGDIVRAGLAVSSFGPHGGYRLARPPEAVSLLEVVEAAEGPLAPTCCVLGEGPCYWEKVCPLHEAWGRATRSLQAELAATSLAELAGTDQAIQAGSYPVPPDTHRPLSTTVAVAESVELERATSAVAQRLRGGGPWLAAHLRAASVEAEGSRMRVGPGGPPWLGKTVELSLGRPTGPDDALVVPVAWEATGATGLFPRFTGELRLVALGPGRCLLSLAGRYRPPLGRAGAVLDEALLAHLARATLRAFLRRVGRSLMEGAGHAVREGLAAVRPALR